MTNNDRLVSVTDEITSENSEQLITQGYETSILDYKEIFNETVGSWMELAKDVYGMANHGGGFIVFGIEDGTFKQKGLDESFHIDSQIWASKLSKWINESLELSYYEHTKLIGGNLRKFPILKIHGTLSKFLIPKINGEYKNTYGQKTVAFNKGVVYTRDNTSTVAASGEQFTKLFWAMNDRTATKADPSDIPIGILSALNNKAEPDSIQEILWSNLFPVNEIPDQIYSATTNYRTLDQIYRRINEECRNTGRDKIHTPAFFLSEKKIFTFTPFDKFNPLAFCTDVILDPIESFNWLINEEKHDHLVMLLNYSLKDLCRRKNFEYDRKKDRYFIKYYGGSLPEVRWKPYKRFSVRKLVNKKLNKEKKLLYCEHFAARMKFMIIGEGIFLNIEPQRVLTEDGINPLDQKRNVRISTRNNSWYHNNNYLYDLKLILHILADNKTEIHLGRNNLQIIVNLQPLYSTIDFGIIDDQFTDGDFLDNLQSEPLEYDIIDDDEPFEINPLTQTSLEE